MKASLRIVLAARVVNESGCLLAKAARKCSQMHSAATLLAVAPCAPCPSSTPHARHGNGVPSASSASSKNVSWFSSLPPIALKPQLLCTRVRSAGADSVLCRPRRARLALFAAGAATGVVSTAATGACCSTSGNRNGARVDCTRRWSRAAAVRALFAAAVVCAHAIATALLSSSRTRRTPLPRFCCCCCCCTPFSLSPSRPEQLRSARGSLILSTVAICPSLHRERAKNV